MAYSSVDIIKAEQPKKKDHYRVKCAATFESMPRLMGWSDDVHLKAVDIDHARNIVCFYFEGDGLKNVPHSKSLEGQEAIEIVPPLWEAIMKLTSESEGEDVN